MKKIKNYQPETLEAARGWLMEECGEVIQAICKDMRFPGGSYPNGETNDQKIWREIADLYAALEGYASFRRGS